MAGPVIEILWDPDEYDARTGLVMDERHEVLEDGEWVKAIRREMGRDDLFVYHHRETGAFVLAQWCKREPRICREVHTMSCPPDQGGWIPMQMLRVMCKPQEERALMIKDMVRTNLSIRREQKAERGQEQRDTVRWLHRKGQEDAAAMVAGSRWAGTTEGGDRMQETKEKLTSAAKGRVVTSGIKPVGGE